MNNIYKRIYNEIKKHDKIVIARHIGPDPDAIASQIALRDIIRFNYEDKNVTGVNITHTKINDFRKFYELKEKDYPDELIMKALIRYRGNRELAFQYLFY